MNFPDLLRVGDLAVEIGQREKRQVAVRGLHLTLRQGERLGLVGESGSGKTLTALSILRLLPSTARVVSGSVQFAGRELLTIPEAEMNRLRGREISMAFQNAHAALNPLFTIGRQISDIYRKHCGGTQREAWKQTLGILSDLSMTEPERTAEAYPHELSGGMAQRAMLAMALVASPKLLIADEPTSGLDPTVQVDVLNVLNCRLSGMRTSLIFISHDIAAVSRICTHMAVMRDGQIVETGPTEQVFLRPSNAYTRELLGNSLTLYGAVGGAQIGT